jgi:hypothetical protein
MRQMAEVNFFCEEDDGAIQKAVVIQGPLVRPSAGPSPFEVSLKTYPMQPWTARSTSGLSQWFNYGLNPTTWTQYSLRQMQLFERAHAAGEQKKK